MHKNIIIGFLAVALLITISVLVYRTEHSITPTQLNDIQVTVSTTTPYEDRVIKTPAVTPSENEEAILNLSDIDYSSLEKDRLYTEEEGKFEKLSEAGQNLLRNLLTSPECVQNKTKCFEHELVQSSVVSLKDGILVLQRVNSKKSTYEIYDLNENGKFIGKHDAQQVNNDEFIVVVEQNYDSADGKNIPTYQNVLYYKPGMTDFKEIPSTKISQGDSESYLSYVGMGYYAPEGSLENNLLTLSIFPYQSNEEIRDGYVASGKLREVTFDLNSLITE